MPFGVADMMLVLVTAAAVAAQPVDAGTAPASSDFDLSRSTNRSVSREQAAPRPPVAPRNMDTRDFAVDMPELELSLAEKGPFILVGAMGGRHSGMPKLAHVALGWSF